MKNRHHHLLPPPTHPDAPVAADLECGETARAVAAPDFGDNVAPDTGHFMPGSIIGTKPGITYTIERLLTDEGSMGAVYLAYDNNCQRTVVIKAPKGREPEELARFNRGRMALDTLPEHPNIVTILDKGESSDNIPFIVIEFLPGYPLRNLMHNGPLSPSQILSFAQQIARAVEHAHFYRIAHRDLKPDNIIVREDGPLKVLDFDIAKSADATVNGIGAAEHLTSPGMTYGTSAYLAPEFFTRKKGDELDLLKADAYSFGVLLYELLTGHLPSSEMVAHPDNLSQLAVYHLHGTPRPITRTGNNAEEIDQIDYLKSLIEKLLDKNPVTRLSMREALIKLGGRPTEHNSNRTKKMDLSGIETPKPAATSGEFNAPDAYQAPAHPDQTIIVEADSLTAVTPSSSPEPATTPSSSPEPATTPSSPPMPAVPSREKTGWRVIGGIGKAAGVVIGVFKALRSLRGGNSGNSDSGES